MTALRRILCLAQAAHASAARSATVFVRDVGHGLLEISHNTLALLGLGVVALLVFASGHADWRHAIEARALNWLQMRQDARADPAELLAAELSEPDAIARTTASNPKELNRQQAAVALWLSRRYKVAPEPVSRLVQEAWTVGARAGLDPTLILAIMAIESSFNPFAQSSVGAQGLMQVMTKVHNDKYEAFGGKLTAFDPVTNLRVGVQVLKECISRAGSLEAGLRYYVGSGNMLDDGGYAGKVLSEQSHLRQVAAGKAVSPSAAATLMTASASAPASAKPPEITPIPAAPLDSGAVAAKVALLQ